MKPKVIVLFPAYNEEANVGKIAERCRPVLEAGIVQEILAVNDGSTDRTAEVLGRYPHVTVISHAKRQGCGDAIRSGYRYALDNGYDICVVMAGNNKDEPAEIQRLIAPILRDEADYVQGSRYLKGASSVGLPWHRNLAIRVFTWTFSLCLLRRLTDCTNGFRAYRTGILRDPRIDWKQKWIGPGYELEYYIHYKTLALGYRVVEVPVTKVYPSDKTVPYTKIRWYDWFHILRPLFYLRLGIRR